MALPRSRIATLRRIADSLLIVLIAVVLFGVVLGRVLPMTGHQTLIIGGGSMEPAIPLGAAVVIDPVAPGDLAVGDVVSLRTGRDLHGIFTHRVTRIVPRSDQLWVETKGDANQQIDPSITPTNQVVGRVTLSIPYAGYLLALLTAPSGVLLVIVVAGFLLVLTWLLESFEIDGSAAAAPVSGAAPPLPAGRPIAASAIVPRYSAPEAIRRRRTRWDMLGRRATPMATASSRTAAPQTADRRGD